MAYLCMRDSEGSWLADDKVGGCRFNVGLSEGQMIRQRIPNAFEDGERSWCFL